MTLDDFHSGPWDGLEFCTVKETPLFFGQISCSVSSLLATGCCTHIMLNIKICCLIFFTDQLLFHALCFTFQHSLFINWPSTFIPHLVWHPQPVCESLGFWSRYRGTEATESALYVPHLGDYCTGNCQQVWVFWGWDKGGWKGTRNAQSFHLSKSGGTIR